MNTNKTSECVVDQEEAFVADYLHRNPRFFLNHQQLLMKLKIPHESGKAVSLLERQLGLYRDKCANLESHLNQLVQVATENEALNKKVNSLVCDIISSRSASDLQILLDKSLRNDFAVDQLRFHLLDGVSFGDLAYSYKPGELQLIRESMNGENILCGRLSDLQKIGMFGSGSESIQSAALIWLSGKSRSTAYWHLEV